MTQKYKVGSIIDTPKGKIKGNKVYSKDTCMFVSANENIVDSLNRRWSKK